MSDQDETIGSGTKQTTKTTRLRSPTHMRPPPTLAFVVERRGVSAAEHAQQKGPEDPVRTEVDERDREP